MGNLAQPCYTPCVSQSFVSQGQLFCFSEDWRSSGSINHLNDSLVARKPRLGTTLTPCVILQSPTQALVHTLPLVVIVIDIAPLPATLSFFYCRRCTAFKLCIKEKKREKKRELLEERDEKDVRDIERFEEVKIKRDVGKDEKVSEMDRRR